MSEIDTDKVFKTLKDKHGEKFARVIRGDVDHGENLCAIPNIVHILEFAGRDENEAEKLRKVILELYKSKGKSQYVTNKNPLQLLDEAGYDAFVVENEEQKNSIKKYYRRGEGLCTFNDPFRHEKYYMIHAVKRGADKIKPAEKGKEKREDEYGTSVISIQIAKPNGGFISIKNRYNHTVNNPDATFDNDPDNIIPGLSNSLKKYFNVDFNVTHAPLPNNFRMVNDQLVRFNHEINNIYFGDYYYFSGSEITKIDKNSQLLFYPDCLLSISKGNNSIISLAQQRTEMAESLTKIIRDKKVAISGKDKNKTISVDGETFIELEDGKITFIHAPNAKKIDLREAKGLHGDLDFSGVEDLDLQGTDLSKVTSIKFNPNAKKIYLHGANGLRGDLDFSGVEELNLVQTDLSKVTSVKFNPNAKEINLYNAKGLHGDLDFSGVEYLDLMFVDLSKVTSIKFNPNAKKITLRGTNGLHGDLDFSGGEDLNLSDADLSKVTSIKFTNAKNINLENINGLHGDLDFSGGEYLNLHNADLSKVTSIKFTNAKKIDLRETKGLHGDLDFSGGEYLYLDYTDLSKVTSIKFNPNAKEIDLRFVKGLHGDLDFSGVEDLDLMFVDLSKVTSIKFTNAKIIHLENIKGLHGDLDFSGVEDLNLHNADLSKVTSIKFTNAKKIYLHDANGLRGDLDFSGVEYLDLYQTDLSKVTSIKFNPDGIINGISDADRLRLEKNNLDTKENEPEIPKKDTFIIKTKELATKIKDKLTGMFHRTDDSNKVQ